MTPTPASTRSTDPPHDAVGVLPGSSKPPRNGLASYAARRRAVLLYAAAVSGFLAWIAWGIVAALTAVASGVDGALPISAWWGLGFAAVVSAVTVARVSSTWPSARALASILNRDPNEPSDLTHVEATIRLALAERLVSVSWHELPVGRAARRWRLVPFAAIAVAAVLCVFPQADIRRVSRTALFPWIAAPADNVLIELTGPARRTVARGEVFRVTARVSIPAARDTAEPVDQPGAAEDGIAGNPAAPDVFLETWLDGERHRWAMQPMGEGRYAISLSTVSDQLSYRVVAGDHRSPAGQVRVVPRPRVASASFHVRSPRYVGRPVVVAQPVTETSSLEVLEGSVLSVAAVVTEPVRDAVLEWTETGSGNIQQQPGRLERTPRGMAWVGDCPVHRSGTVRWRFVSEETGLTGVSQPVRVTALADAEPLIRAEVIGGSRSVASDATLRLRVLASDDVGLAQLTEDVSVNHGPWMRLRSRPLEGIAVDLQPRVSLAAMNVRALRAGDSVALRLTVTDLKGQTKQINPLQFHIGDGATQGVPAQLVARTRVEAKLAALTAGLSQWREALQRQGESLPIKPIVKPGEQAARKEQLAFLLSDAAAALSTQTRVVDRQVRQAMDQAFDPMAVLDLHQLSRWLSPRSHELLSLPGEARSIHQQMRAGRNVEARLKQAVARVGTAQKAMDEALQGWRVQSRESEALARQATVREIARALGALDDRLAEDHANDGPWVTSQLRGIESKLLLALRRLMKQSDATPAGSLARLEQRLNGLLDSVHAMQSSLQAAQRGASSSGSLGIDDVQVSAASQWASDCEQESNRLAEVAVRQAAAVRTRWMRRLGGVGRLLRVYAAVARDDTLEGHARERRLSATRAEAIASLEGQEARLDAARGAEAAFLRDTRLALAGLLAQELPAGDPKATLPEADVDQREEAANRLQSISESFDLLAYRHTSLWLSQAVLQLKQPREGLIQPERLRRLQPVIEWLREENSHLALTPESREQATQALGMLVGHVSGVLPSAEPGAASVDQPADTPQDPAAVVEQMNACVEQILHAIQPAVDAARQTLREHAPAHPDALASATG